MKSKTQQILLEIAEMTSHINETYGSYGQMFIYENGIAHTDGITYSVNITFAAAKEYGHARSAMRYQLGDEHNKEWVAALSIHEAMVDLYNNLDDWRINMWMCCNDVETDRKDGTWKAPL